MHPPFDLVNQRRLTHRFLGSLPQISEYHLAPGPFIRSHHDRKRGLPGICQLQLFAESLGTERIFDPKTSVSHLMSQGKHVRHILFADECNEYIKPDTIGRSEPPVLQQLAQHHVAHSETQGREIDATQLLQQVVVSAAAADGPQRSSGIEQLEHYSGIVGQSPDDGEVDLHKIAETHVGERPVHLAQWLAGLDRLGRPFQLLLELLPAANPGYRDEIIHCGGLKDFNLVDLERLNLFLLEPLVLVDEIKSSSETVRPEIPVP